MKSLSAGFRFIDRGFRHTLVLLPGWASDGRIFGNLDLDYNYLIPLRTALTTFEKDLANLLRKQSLSKISLLGWSLGGFLACDFARKFPDRVNELILLGIRERFKDSVLKDAEEALRKNRRAYLYRFYLNCFSDADHESLSWFKKNLLTDYLAGMDLKTLVRGLNYLGRCRIEPSLLAGIKKIAIFHGSQDKIAPLGEALNIKSRLPGARFVRMEKLGHIFFLNPKFKENFGRG